MFDKVQICGVDTQSLIVLSGSKMKQMFIQMRGGDRLARERLIKGNLRLVLSVVQRFQNRGELLDDLFQIGVIGLIKAVDNFDLSHNVRFSTYAVPMIIGEIRRYLRDNSQLRVSRSLKDTAYRALKARERLCAELSREPTIAEIAAAIGMAREEVVFAIDAVQEPMSLFEPVFHDGGDPIYVVDQISDETQSDGNWAEGISIQQALDKLTEREKQVLTLRFFHGRTQMQVATAVGISQAQVSRLEKGALLRLQTQL